MSLLVEKIIKGSVIDRLEVFSSLRVLEILGLSQKNSPESVHKYRIVALINVPSKKMGRKDILKIDGHLINSSEANKISLICPNATVNIIENAKVISKKNVQLPKEICSIALCPNPNCISFNNKLISKFTTENKKLRCHFCERVFEAHELIL